MMGILKNKVILYIGSRYLTYGIQFINSLFIAIALGPTYFAIWGFINLILQYIAQFNMGIPYSLNVMLSINKSDPQKVKVLLSSSFFLYAILSIALIVLFSLISQCNLKLGEKYLFDNYWEIVISIAVLMHFNTLFTNYFRIENKLLEIVFYQSITPIAMLIAISLSKEESLLWLLLWLMLIGQCLSLFIYIKNTSWSFIKPQKKCITTLIRKGFYLFVYNTCFYLIMLSTRTIVSSAYTVEEFGFFTFSFTLANTIMLLFDSFSFLIYPKTINRLNSANKEETKHILYIIRSAYITSVHLVMYIFLSVFPFFIQLFPQYSSTFKSFALISMTVILYTNCFAYSSLLTAKGKERILGFLSFITLLLNMLIAFFIAYVLQLDYEYVILATLFAYIIYSILLSKYSYKSINMQNDTMQLLKENFPIRLFLPFIATLFAIIIELPWYSYILLLLFFVVINYKKLYYIKNILSQISKKPSIINI